ncbi:hypothetical protein [Hymenobacter metallicola]|uniref:FCP1 homology domain-containing protein n=1 Tax=Hymenobacter metallicola TaxID=2563114 RepID=A0A4Z0QGX4_9BACT|nr:hypothetical protein [Hymenobacter metallicola]TGE28579.1 hypothetical protein E5K02_03695 [Hymenobacter metallicola]
MTNLYLDIDGVLVTAKHTRAAPGVEGFVRFITANFTCYWLTTHCKGNSASALKYLAHFLDAETLGLLASSVRATTWDALKTEAIDLTLPFYWLDDQPFQAEIARLQAANVADRLVVVDLKQANELARLQEFLWRVLNQ